MLDKKIEWIDLFTTMACNLKCSYCFHPQSQEKMVPQDAIKYLEILKPTMKDNCLINFFGGEPLLNFAVIEAVVNYTKLNNLKYKFGISTNGTIFDEKQFRFMQIENFSIQVSIDGDEATQNQFRGSYKVIEENVKKMIQLGIVPSARPTFAPENIKDLSHNMIHLHKMGFLRVMHQAVMEGDWNQENIEEYKKQYDIMSKFYRENPKFKATFYNLSKLNKKSHHCTPDDITCKAGKSLIALTPDGSVYACHRFASNDQFKLGDINSFHRGIFNDISRKDMIDCHTCEAVKTCHTCIAVHYKANGSIAEQIKKYCELIRAEHNKMKEEKQKMPNDRLETIEKKIDIMNDLLLKLCQVVLSSQDESNSNNVTK